MNWLLVVWNGVKGFVLEYGALILLLASVMYLLYGIATEVGC